MNYQTPYGNKTGELLTRAMDTYTHVQNHTIDVLERSLRALHEDDFPQLREEIRNELRAIKKIYEGEQDCDF